MTLPDLIKRLEAYELPDPAGRLSHDLRDFLGLQAPVDAYRLLTSLDAVAALTKERLPDALPIGAVKNMGSRWYSWIGLNNNTRQVEAYAKTETCARLIALLRAMDAENEG